jgi:hypothetical protein
MPTIIVPGGLRNFNAFWCDGPATGVAPEPGMVLLAFDRPLPANCLLAILGTRDGFKQSDCLSLHGLSRTNDVRIHAVPVPADWSRFGLTVLCLGGAAELGRVDLKFDRYADTATDKKQPAVQHVFLQGNRLCLEPPPNGGKLSTAMRLYQRTDTAGTYGPVSRLADQRNPTYQIHAPTLRPPPNASPGSQQGNHPFTVILTANTPEAARALEDTRLWHAPLALLGEDRSTVGIFESQQPRGFRIVQAVHSRDMPRRLTFGVAGAAPGDVLGLTTGLGECSIAIGQGLPDPSRIAAGPCAVFEIDHDGALQILQGANVRPSIIPMGENSAAVVREIEYQLERITAKWSGARTETARLAQLLENGSNDAPLVDFAARAASPVIFAVGQALLARLRGSCPTPAVAADIEAILDPRRMSFLNRLSSAAIGLAIEHEDIRSSLLRQASGNFDPWSDADGLHPIFEAVFNRPARVTGNQPFEPDKWYELTPDCLARIAILTMANAHQRGSDSEFKVARRLIGAGLQPELCDAAMDDVDALLTLSENYLVGPPPDPALADALSWATIELSQGVDHDAALTDIENRLKEARDDAVSHQSSAIALRDLRRWRKEIKFEEIVARLSDIRSLLRNMPGGTPSTIPRFDRESPGFNGLDRANLVTELMKVEVPEAWRALARNAGESSKWPNAALAALLATLRAIAQPIPAPRDPTRELHPDALEDIRNAGPLFDPETGTGGLLNDLKQLAEQEFASLESELLGRAVADGEIGPERRAIIRDNARQGAAISAARELLRRVDEVIDAVGKEFGKLDPAVRKADVTLRALTGSARQRAANQLRLRIDEVMQLRTDYVSGIETRLRRVRRVPREGIFADVAAIDEDIRSARQTEHDVQELLFLIGKLPAEE